MKTHCETHVIDRLDSLPLDEMWQIFQRHYEGASRSIFEHDLLSKDQALLLWRGDLLIGFTSQRFAVVSNYNVIYSGDVIIDAGARDIGTAHFFHQWARAVWKRCDWWCALSAGPRTFRIPHTFYHRVTPSMDVQETAQEQALRHEFSTHGYGDAYCRESGIVRLKNTYTLCENEQKLRDAYPLDAYFRKANPGWQHGDELVSLISLHPNNWKPIAMRILNWRSALG